MVDGLMSVWVVSQCTSVAVSDIGSQTESQVLHGLRFPMFLKES